MTKDVVGVWIAQRRTSQQPNVEVAVDLLVPESVSPGKGRRAAKLPGHSANAARIVKGLEGAIVDAQVMRISSLEVAIDARTFNIRVAGPAALLVAKLHKIQDRQGTSRQSDKDALDIFRLLRGISTKALSDRYKLILGDKRSRDVSEAALSLLGQQFTSESSVGVKMVLRAIGSLADPKEIAASCKILATDLLDAVER